MDLNQINYSCNFCDRNFYTKTGFRFHIETHSKESTLNSPAEEKPVEEKSHSLLEERTLKENHQEESFLSKEGLGKINSKTPEIIPQDKQLILSNKDTGQKFEESTENVVKAANDDGNQDNNHLESVLKKNTPLVQKPFNCQSCEKSYVHEIHLKNHIAAVHENLQPFNCQNNETSSATNIVNDIIKPFNCNICQNKFESEVGLKIHIGVVHDKVKLLNCHICQKHFKSTHGLNTHIAAVHDKLKPFQCPNCSKCFSRKSELQYHIIAIHDKTKLHQCHICKKCYPVKRNLNLHVKRAHMKK